MLYGLLFLVVAVVMCMDAARGRHLRGSGTGTMLAVAAAYAVCALMLVFTGVILNHEMSFSSSKWTLASVLMGVVGSMLVASYVRHHRSGNDPGGSAEA